MKSKLLLTLFLLTVFAKISLSRENGKELWKKSFTPTAGFTSKANAWASQYISFSLSLPDVKNYLSQSPHEKISSLRNSSFVFSIPKPDGTFDDFKIVESPVMEDGLADAYPSIKTYAGQGISDPTATVRFDITQFGFHAMVISPNGTYFIDPPAMNSDADYISYYKKDALKQDAEQQCLVDAQSEAGSLRNQNPNSPLKSISGELRTYRLALAADYEYTVYYGGTVPGALAGMVTTMNRVNGVYEREFGIHMNLVANDTLLIFTTSADPYTNSNGSAMLGQNQTTCNNIIGSANYDIGHVFSTGGGGVAGLGVICNAGMKAWGVTGLTTPIGDGFDIDYVAHEMGHQFGGNHSFNSVSGFCGGNREPLAAYEPGSASTIMGYAGICSSDDLQPHSDDYFNTNNFDEIVDYTQISTGNICAAITTNFNSAPVLTLPANFTIPLNTPFRLVATATDPDLDSLTYCWEEYDLGPAGTWNNPSGDAPIFRSFNPVTTGTRLFPKLLNILNNNTTIGEIKASYARTLNFRCTVRDNVLSAAGVTYNDSPVQVTVANTPGPFAVLTPNVTGITWLAGTLETITWSVNGSDQPPVSTPNVNVLLSLDGGNNFIITLGSNVPNNGSLSIWVPNVSTSTARVMVEGAGNIFFDINDKNFTINPLGVEENNFSNAVTIFPNPVKDMFELVVANEDQGDIEISITDAIGKITGNYLVHKNENIVHFNFDFSKQAAGVYFVKLRNEKSEAVKRIVKF